MTIPQTRHNHLTRDIKAFGKCPVCDEYWRAEFPDAIEIREEDDRYRAGLPPKPKMRALDDRELHDYLAACTGATDEELLDIKAADGISLRDILTEANIPVVTDNSEIHAEGRALVQGILDRKAAQA